MTKDEKWIRLMRIGERAGCHQMPERSFFYKHYQFPVCARCTGVVLASVIATLMFFAYKVPFYICVVFCIVMFADWFIQRIGVKKSTNTRRFITGLLGGYGVMTIQLYAAAYIFDLFKERFILWMP